MYTAAVGANPAYNCSYVAVAGPASTSSAPTTTVYVEIEVIYEAELSAP
jgi:hypothetical protein